MFVHDPHSFGYWETKRVAIKHVDPVVRRPECKSNLYYLLAGMDQFLSCLLLQTAASQMDNNNTLNYDNLGRYLREYKSQ